MVPPENQYQSLFKRNVRVTFDGSLRVIALFLGLTSLAGYHRFSKIIGVSMDLLILSHAVLMFLCVVMPSRFSRVWLTALFASILFVGVDFFMRELPYLQREGYPFGIVVFYLIELIVVIWFLYRHVVKVRKANTL